MGKRAVSRANVASKRQRLDAELGELITKEDQLEFQRDLDEVVAGLKAEPWRLKAVKAVMKMGDGGSYDPSTHLSPDTLRRSISRLPLWWLKDFIISFGVFSREQVLAMGRSDPKFCIKVLQRVTMLPLTCPIWTNSRTGLQDGFKRLMEALRQDLHCIVFDRHFIVDWQHSGIFQLNPPLVDWELGDEDAMSAHQYTSITCMGHKASLEGIYVVRGTWGISNNWCFWEAALYCPAFPEANPKCYYSFFATDVAKAIDHTSAQGLCQLELPESEPRALTGSVPNSGLSLCDGAADAANSSGGQSSGSHVVSESVMFAVEIGSSAAQAGARPKAAPMVVAPLPPPKKVSKRAKAAEALERECGAEASTIDSEAEESDLQDS